jgi:hypothetical protein
MKSIEKFVYLINILLLVWRFSMVVIIKIGRRLPRSWYKRTASKVKGLMTFQENIWIIIDRSLVIAKKKCAQTPNGGVFVKKNYREIEDIHWDLEWIECEYRGNPDQEAEEYEEAMGMYKSIGQLFKAELPKDENISKAFKTARLTGAQLDTAYKSGYVNSATTNIAQRLLELGIITYIEKIEEKASLV